MTKTIASLLPIFLLVFSVVAGYFIHQESQFTNERHFVQLAEAFIKNDLFLSPFGLPNGDYADYFGKQYLFFGPMPSLLLVPFVLIFGYEFPQMFLSVVSIFVTYVTVYLLCKRFKFNRVDSLWLANFFLFGSVLYFVSVVNISAYVVQAVVTPFVMLSLYEYFGKKRWALLGMFTAAAILTRVTLVGMAVFFMIELVRTTKKPELIKSSVLFLLPILVCVSLLGLYNFRRFNSPFNTGYTLNVTAVHNVGGNHEAGFFSPVHIPGNLYALLFMGPGMVNKTTYPFLAQFPYLKANGWGLAIWYTSPLLVYLIKARLKGVVLSAVGGILIIAAPSLLYYGIGMSQYGYRYSLDFFPLLFLILLTTFKEKLPTLAKIIILVGVLFNLFYMLSIWNAYPLFFWLNG